MIDWRWCFYALIGSSVVLTLVFVFLLIKRHRGHGYFLSKFSAFTRIRFGHLEHRRQTYCPADKTCQCHPTNSAAHIEPSVACPHRAPTLYMSFAGAAMIVGGVRTTEWRGSMTEVHVSEDQSFDALFLTDPAQCFYLQDPDYRWQGLNYYRGLVDKYATLYQRVILIGASLGGSMVCMCADLATISLAFNPILDPTLLGLPWRVMGAFCPARQARVIREQVHTSMEKIKKNEAGQNCVLHIHWSELSAPDQRQACRIVGGGKQKKPRQTECLTSVAKFDIANRNLRSSAGVYVWFHQCARHALAMFLKRSNQLIPLLQQHLLAGQEDVSENASHVADKQSTIISMPMTADDEEITEHEVRLALL